MKYATIMKYATAILIFCLLVALFGCSKSDKWRTDMPGNGATLCSLSGEGFKVTNTSFGFHLDREQKFDLKCKEALK